MLIFSFHPRLGLTMWSITFRISEYSFYAYLMFPMHAAWLHIDYLHPRWHDHCASSLLAKEEKLLQIICCLHNTLPYFCGTNRRLELLTFSYVFQWHKIFPWNLFNMNHRSIEKCFKLEIQMLPILRHKQFCL